MLMKYLQRTPLLSHQSKYLTHPTFLPKVSTLKSLQLPKKSLQMIHQQKCLQQTSIRLSKKALQQRNIPLKSLQQRSIPLKPLQQTSILLSKKPDQLQRLLLPKESRLSRATIKPMTEEETAGNTEKLQDRAREVVSICASCTIMLFTEYEGPCPYSFTSLMGPDRESYSRLLHTTCFSCVNKYKHEWVSREQFGNGCMTAFRAAMLSEE